MSKTKLEKHIEELEELTSGNSKDAVTFAGRGLDLLKSMLGLKKSAGEADEEDADEDPEDPADTNEEQGKAKNSGAGMEKSVKNGGDIESADEDPEDPADTGNDASGGSIITNKGKTIAKDSSPAVKKSFVYNEETLVKSMDRYEDVIDASEAVSALAKSVLTIGRAHADNSALIKSVMEQNKALAGAVAELLKSNASIAAEMESLKKQPVTSPATGFVVMSKKEGSVPSAETRLRKSDIQDVIVEAMNEGHEEAPSLLKKLGVLHNNVDLKHFVDEVMPEDLRSKL